MLYSVELASHNAYCCVGKVRRFWQDDKAFCQIFIVGIIILTLRYLEYDAKRTFFVAGAGDAKLADGSC